eukprot:366497-Chlamydomonas_euryale.AAC.8
MYELRPYLFTCFSAAGPGLGGLSHGWQGRRELSALLSTCTLGAPQAAGHACRPLQARQPNRQDHRQGS